MFRHALTVGHIAAIPVRVHWSWLIIFGLLVASLSPIYAFYTAAPGAWALGTAMGLALCGAVLLHELAHALVARRFRVPVGGITLFALGGVAEVQADAPGPAVEFAIAVAGPAASALIALCSGLAWWAAAALGAPALVATLAAHLTLSNAIMALFNLLPGYPMDGGRIVRAVLWFLTDDMPGSTRIAARTGQVCGALLGVGGGVLALASGQLLAALWLGLIGIFLYRTAVASFGYLVVQSALHGVRVADLMQRRFCAITADLTLEQFVGRYLLGQSMTSFPVVEDGPPRLEPTDAPDPVEYAAGTATLIGMISLREMRRYTLHDWALTRVGAAMLPREHLHTVPPHVSAADALQLMRDARLDILPITEGTQVVGLLHKRDLLLYIQMKMARR